MITRKAPDNWRHLQNLVGEILDQCGLQVEIEKKINSKKSTIEVDVYAEETIDDRLYSIVCECKYWQSNIPQLYVHALRTVTNDLGVNKSYIISTSGFQSGAKKSIEKTNIELVKWSEFQAIFFKSWYVNYFSNKLHGLLFNDYDPMAIQFFDNFELIERNVFCSLISKFNCLKDIEDHFPHPINISFSREFLNIEDKLPLCEKLNKGILEEWELSGCSLPKHIIEETHYLEFLNELEQFAKPIFNELDKLDLHIDYN